MCLTQTCSMDLPLYLISLALKWTLQTLPCIHFPQPCRKIIWFWWNSILSINLVLCLFTGWISASSSEAFWAGISYLMHIWGPSALSPLFQNLYCKRQNGCGHLWHISIFHMNTNCRHPVVCTFHNTGVNLSPRKYENGKSTDINSHELSLSAHLK